VETTPRVSANDQRRLKDSSPPSGLLAAVIIQDAGFNFISAAGGQADPAMFQRLTGQMLVPFVIGLGLAGVVKLQRMRRSPGGEPDPWLAQLRRLGIVPA
jgi:hypothetical protein